MPYVGAPPFQVRKEIRFLTLDFFSRRAGVPINQDWSLRLLVSSSYDTCMLETVNFCILCKVGLFLQFLVAMVSDWWNTVTQKNYFPTMYQECNYPTPDPHTSLGCFRRKSLSVSTSPAAAAATITAGFSRRDSSFKWRPMSSLSKSVAACESSRKAANHYTLKSQKHTQQFRFDLGSSCHFNYPLRLRADNEHL